MMSSIMKISHVFQAARQHWQLTFAFSIALLFIWLLFNALYQRLFSPLRKIPGPFLASITRYWQLKKILNGTWHEEIIQLHRKYGEIVRIAPNEISFTSSEAVQKAYGHTGAPYVKDEWYHTWYIPNIGHGVFAETDISEHRNLRRRVAKAYSMTYILVMEQYVDRLVTLFEDQMRSRENQRVDLSSWTQFFAFDVVGELAFGKDFGLLTAGTDFDGLCDAAYVYMTCTSMMGWSWLKSIALIFPWWHWILNNAFLKRAGHHINGSPGIAFGKVVTRTLKLRKDPDKQNLLNHFLSMENSDGSPVAEKDVFFESMNVVGAGADTTAISTRAIIRYACSSPRVYKKLQEEIDTASSGGKLSPSVQFTEGQNLPYCQAVIKEALRLFPAVGFQLPRVVPQGGVEISGYFLSAKSIISINGWALHRNKHIFGEDADEFRPERWLEGDTKNMEACFASFGFGSRTCIGKNLALMEINKLVPTLLRDFDIEICDVENPWQIITAWFSYQSDFYVRLKSGGA